MFVSCQQWAPLSPLPTIPTHNTIQYFCIHCGLKCQQAKLGARQVLSRKLLTSAYTRKYSLITQIKQAAAGNFYDAVIDASGIWSERNNNSLFGLPLVEPRAGYPIGAACSVQRCNMQGLQASRRLASDTGYKMSEGFKEHDLLNAYIYTTYQGKCYLGLGRMFTPEGMDVCIFFLWHRLG